MTSPYNYYQGVARSDAVPLSPMASPHIDASERLADRGASPDFYTGRYQDDAPNARSAAQQFYGNDNSATRDSLATFDSRQQGSFASSGALGKEAYSDSTTHLPGGGALGYGAVGSKAGSRGWSAKKKWLTGGGLALVVIIAAAVVGGVVAARHSSSSPSGGKAASDNGHNNNGVQLAANQGGDGSVVTTEDGSTFIYNNTFGGFWASTPFDDSARVRNDTPPLSEQWDFSTDLIQGVNLGGWLVLEPFITPGRFEPYETAEIPAIDEYTLMQNLGTNATNVMIEHYSTFITEIDFARIAGAGLTWIRLPIPFWFIEVYEGEPFVEGVGWQYFLKALTWARKYGLRMELDFHCLPGSQNGLNHSGKFGSINFLNGVMGIVNAQRALSYIQTLAEFISQPQYKNVVQMFMPANEAYYQSIGANQMRAFYLEAYKVIRAASGFGVGNGPMISIHDGFVGQGEWAGFMSGADRLALEVHPYLAFSSFSSASYGSLITRPCQWWAAGYNTSMNAFGFTMNGEWCLATNDCGQYVNGVGLGSRYDGSYNGTGGQVYGNCSQYTDYENFSDAFKLQMRQMATAYMDMSRNWMFWTWKIGTSSRTGKVPNPQWSYSLGLQEGYIPTDPRLSNGACEALAAELNLPGRTAVQWTPPLQNWMTGGVGANTIAASATANFSQWPPASLTNIPNVANLPTLTATGTPITMSAATPTGSLATGNATNVGNGWHNPSDTARYNVPVSGCSYMNAYSGLGIPTPSAPCNGGAARRMARMQPTPAPVA